MTKLKLKKAKVVEKLKKAVTVEHFDIKVEEKSKKAKTKRRSEFFMGGVGMMVPYIPVNTGT